MKLTYRLYDDIFEGQRFGYEFYAKRLKLALEAEFPNATVEVTSDNSPRADYGALTDDEAIAYRARAVDDDLWQSILATKAWQAGGCCNVLNDTQEWVVAGSATIKKVNDDGTYAVQTACGVCVDVPPQCIDEPRYICKGCEDDCDFLCGDKGSADEMTYAQLLQVVADYNERIEHRYL